MHLTFSNKIKVEKYLSEISRRDALSVEQILNLPEIMEINSNQKLNNSQKGEKLVDFLYSLRYPEITKCEQKYKKAVKAGNIKHSTNFEGVDVSFQFNSEGDYELRINAPEK
ncbi:MAG: hypothetical protein KKH91_02180 [Elusimicrobia bacterium]|nr:hypothetical protein [Elusimicrobiota bacterium]MBU2614160.1 hypothetical protein [Elusimicrobiota bacterium]